MSIKTDLNIAPYFDDYDIANKYYRVLFKPGFAVQARELTQLQTTLQNQIEQFGENIYKEGSIIKGCTFTEIRNLQYAKVVDSILLAGGGGRARPEDFIERTVVQIDGTVDEYYFEIEDSSGLKSLIIQGTSGFQSRAPDLNTFFMVYLNTVEVEGIEKKVYEPNDSLSVREYILRTQVVEGVSSETTIDNGIVASTSVAGFSSPIGKSFGLNSSEGIVFQRGHFLFVDDQTVIVSKYLSEVDEEDPFAIQPNNTSVGYAVDESIVNSQQDTSLLDNANGSANENAPGADRLLLVPRLIALNTVAAEADAEFFILRRYENGYAVETRNVSEFNSIAKELARRTYETNGDFTKNKFQFEIVKNDATDTFFVEMGEGIAYSKGYRIANDSKRIFEVPNANTATFDINSQPVNFNYGGFCKVIAATGSVTIGTMANVSLLNSSLVAIGSAIVKNYTRDRVYLYAIRMNTGQAFENVGYVKEGSTNGQIQITPKIINSSESKLIFDANKSFVKSLSDMSFSIRKSKVAPSSAGTITVEPAVDEVFDAETLRDVLVIQSNNNTASTITNTAIVGSNLVITTSAGTQNVTVYYNAKLTSAEQRVKQLLDVYVKTTYKTDADISKYTLGLPDVAEIISIVDSSNKDFTSSFRLVKNQKDNFYDHSYIEKIPGRTLPANNAALTIKVRTFKVDVSSDINFFTVDSYVNIDQEYVSYFETENGDVFDLKSSIDFRPYRLATASYSATVGGATTLAPGVSLPTSATQLFDIDINHVVPAFNTSASVDIEYYGSRVDYIVGNSYGRFKYIVGDVTGNSANAIDKSENSIIAEITVPGYPLLSSELAARLGRRNETLQLTRKTTKTYTMQDIDKISSQLDQITYYTQLTALENATRDLLIQDENGLNRFKNGIVVDPFNDLSIADVSDPTFNSSVDFTENALYPSFRQFPLNLKVKGFTDTQSFDVDNKTATLSSNQYVRFLRQQYATNVRTCTSNFYSYKGTGYLTPEYDVAYDTVTTPKTYAIDLVSPFAEFAEAISEFVPLTSSKKKKIKSTNKVSETGNAAAGRQITTTTTDTFKNIFKELNVASGPAQEEFVGDFVTNFQYKPYIKSIELSVEMYGLRPNTQHFFFFDEKIVDDFIAPGTLRSDISGATSGDRVRRAGKFGTSVTTNSNGELFAIFKIPGNTFIIGERELVIADVGTFEDIESAAASAGRLKFNAYNFSIEKTGLTMSTRKPEFDIKSTRSVTTTNSVTIRNIPPVPPVIQRSERDDRDPPRDPLAQTFFVKDTMTQGADCLYLGRLDLYFSRKSATNGITVMIREVENGYPSFEILPFSKIHLRASQVNISNDASVVTSIIFEAPVRLDAEKEYAIVVMPDAADPDYLIFTQKVGGTDLLTGTAVNSDWGDGVLFTSTNNRSWNSYQDEDIRFDLYRYNFNVDQGTVELETDNAEFFSIQNTVGGFANNELAYVFTAAVGTTYQLVLNVTTNVVTGSALNNYSAGDYVYVEHTSGEKDLLRVVSVTNSTQIIVDKLPKFAGTINSRPVVAGKINYFNTRKPDFLVLEDSSARDTRIFASAGIIYGIDSGATASIVSVDNIELSYIQAMVNRITDTNTNVRTAVKAIDPAAPGNAAYTSEFSFADKKAFNEKGCVVYSKSNDITNDKNLRVVLTLEKDSIATTTPLVDIETAKIFAYVYNITDTVETTSKYISKRVELQEGFDAEDFRLYLTGYRPIGSDIKVYLKVKNGDDPVSLRNNEWFELDKIEGSTLFSSTSNVNDYKEFVFEIPETEKLAGITTYTNSTGTYYSFRSFSIRIDLLSDDVARVPKVLDYRGISFQ
jgi:hypothetical protein